MDGGVGLTRLERGSEELKGADYIDNGGNVSSPRPKRQLLARALDYILEETTFFRVHLAAFTFIPLIFSGIFFASNGRFRISFLDSMFLCYSAMTVTGLSTVNLSTLTGFQQVILYFLMTIGDITIVAWTMVLIRKRFFKTHCEYVVAKRPNGHALKSRASFIKSISAPIGAAFKQRQPTPRQNPPQPPPPPPPNTATFEAHVVEPTPVPTLFGIPEEQDNATYGLVEGGGRGSYGARIHASPKSENNLVLSPHPQDQPPSILSPTSHVTSNFFSPTSENGMRPTVGFASAVSPRTGYYNPMLNNMRGRAPSRRSATVMSSRSRIHEMPALSNSAKYTGLGGFPGPVHVLNRVAKMVVPGTYKKFERTLSMDTNQTLHSSSIPWLNFSGLRVGRNSDFHTDTLTDEQLEDIGGAEYRALRLLSYLVPAYFVLWQVFSIILFLPWLLSSDAYNDVFANQFRNVTKPWFAFFQVMGAYTGGGLSLVDLGMLPFGNAYLMIIALSLVILAGNHALPIFLRLLIWTSSKLLPDDSEAQVALSFLLDHPRRCFLYMFPSHQTWFLVIVLVLFSVIEWVLFLVLNIGIPVYEALPTAQKVIDGLFQGLAARASGFSIVPLASYAPALQFLYVVMMYIAVYPVAISIRSTNVYEERSLGIFEEDPEDDDEEPSDLNNISSSKERVGRYLGWHLRRQLSIDIWWLVSAVFLVAVIERANLQDDSKKWFDLFRVLFELVSAFGGIGLSLGLPSDNFSFAGAMSPLSKLVIIVIMVRGRHRGLPVAVDRAVVLPSELVTQAHDTKGRPQQTHGQQFGAQEGRSDHILSPITENGAAYTSMEIGNGNGDLSNVETLTESKKD